MDTTTIRVRKEIKRKIKQVAAEEDTSMQKIVEQSFVFWLEYFSQENGQPAEKETVA